ncbi:DUF4037 domain-containing protein [Candidatus Thorarchaeota archaeon]|nr:MAG: DUF4037 domain-containing protein [Candidatus Thorarchaeota archaeon]
MNKVNIPNYEFIPGLELCKIFYIEAVKPILEEHFPDLIYSAAHMGSGSDVLGFDTPQSMDHGWGPRLLLFLRETDLNTYRNEIDQTLRENLPYEVRGFPTNFTIHDDGSLMMTSITSGPVNHAIKISTVSEFFTEYFGLFPSEDFSIIDWLTIPEQILRSIVGGRIFYDGLGELQPIITRLQYYPHELWLYLLANQWRRISQEDAIMGRCGQVGDELGSRIVATRLVRDMMRLCFLMEKEYAPYIKWFGTAFSKLDCAKKLEPLFLQTLDADNWKQREIYLVEAYEYVADMHNRLGITRPLNAKTIYFHNRPFRIIQSERFASEISSIIKDEEVRKLPCFLGGIDQYVDSTDVLGYTNRYRRFWSMYQ